MAKGTASSDAVTKNQLDTKLSLSGGLMTGNLDMNNNRLYNVAQPNGDNQPAKKNCSENKFLDKSSGVMAGSLNMSNNKITHLAKPTDDNGRCIDNNYLKLSGGTMNGNIILNSTLLLSQYQALSWTTGNAFFVQITNPYVYSRFNMVKNKIINLGDPTDATDVINKQYLEKSHVKPSHYNNEFKYLMTNKLRRTDLQADSFNIIKIDNLMRQDCNYYQYNHKVLYTTIIKDQQGGYSYKMGINCYQLDKDKHYTLCIENPNSDYQLWHKSVATIDKTTSQRVTIAGFTLQKFSHQYTNSNGNVEYMYYIKIIVNFQKTVTNLPYSLHLYVNIPQAGIDLNIYPTNWTKNWIIAYGVFGKVSSIDPQKTYDYHTVFDIKPTEVVFNVDLDMNRKKILNIAPDKTRNNSAATVKMLKDLETKLSPRTKNNAYREIFEEFYDLSDAGIYKIASHPPGIIFYGLLPNMTFFNINVANIEKGGLRIQNKPLNLALFSKKSFTICVVMQLWLNRAMYIKTFMINEADEKPHFIYDKTTKKLTLQTNGLKIGTANETFITLLDSFNGKRVVFWLTKKGIGGTPTVKASISNHSATLTLSSALASQSNYTFRTSSEDAVIHKVMYTPNFYDLDSIEFHRIMIQEKLSRSYVL